MRQSRRSLWTSFGDLLAERAGNTGEYKIVVRLRCSGRKQSGGGEASRRHRFIGKRGQGLRGGRESVGLMCFATPFTILA